MPNGHGGVPRFGAPVLLAVLFLAVHGARPGEAGMLFDVLEVALVLAFAWRLAWHLFMWQASEYDGAYVSEAESRRAVFMTSLFTVLFAVAGMAAWYLLR